MSKAKHASRLAAAITRFLVHKRALGHRYRHEAWLLSTLLRHVEQIGCQDLNAQGFDRWSAGLRNNHPNTRRKWYEIVRLFCLYRRRREPGCFLPPADGAPKRQPYVTPVIVEPGQILRMLEITSRLRHTNVSPLRGPVRRLAIVLLYTCGLRLGELLRLTMGDVEEHGTVLRIRESKFRKSRLVPLSVSAAHELQRYLRMRRKTFAVHPNTPLLGHRLGGRFHPYGLRGLAGAVTNLFEAAGVQGEGGRRPRVHDLRHSFAVQALLRWYRAGADVQAQLPKLALYMGHVSIVSSAYYLHWVPALQQLASDRFEQRFGHLVQGGAR